MICLFIINPSSGTKTIQKQLDVLIGRLILQNIVHHVDIFYTRKKDDAYKRTLEIDLYDFVVVVGGDGTVNEVIRGFVERQLDIPLCIIPGGTVNDFANHLQLPKNTNDIIKMIKQFKTIKVDVGKVNDLYFANVIAGGMFSDISFQVSKQEKEIFGPLAYYMSGIRQLPSQLSTHLHLIFNVDGEEFEEDARLFMITNTSQVGGFKGIAPKATVSDGELDLLIIKKKNISDFINHIRQNGINNHQNNAVYHYIQAKHIIVNCKENIVYDIDGEIGTGFPIDVTVMHQAIRLLIP